jgi:hypothetical protein
MNSNSVSEHDYNYGNFVSHSCVQVQFRKPKIQLIILLETFRCDILIQRLRLS